MNITVLTAFCLIVLARITDASLDTTRMVPVIQGRRAFAAVPGFFEAIVHIGRPTTGDSFGRAMELSTQRIGINN